MCHYLCDFVVGSAGESWRDFAERRKEKGWAAGERQENEEGAKRREAKRSRRGQKPPQPTEVAEGN